MNRDQSQTYKNLLAHANEHTKAMSEEHKQLSDLLRDMETFNGPKFIRVAALWSRCVAADVSPFITRAELKKEVDFAEKCSKSSTFDVGVIESFANRYGV
jgi:hypothetical protein